MNISDIKGMNAPKVNDIYRWKFIDDMNKDHTSLYWCCSRICVYRENGKFYDTYWGSGSNKSFTIDDINSKIDLEYIGNFDELEDVEKTQRAYYNDEDCVDISHSNARGGFYIKKNAKKSLDKMKRVHKRIIYHLQNEIKWKQQRLDDMKERLQNFNEDSYISTTEEVSLYDDSYEDEV